MLSYKDSLIKEQREVKNKIKWFDAWINTHSSNINEEFLAMYKKRNNLKIKLLTIKDRLSDKHKLKLGAEEVIIPTNINNLI